MKDKMKPAEIQKAADKMMDSLINGVSEVLNPTKLPGIPAGNPPIKCCVLVFTGDGVDVAVGTSARRSAAIAALRRAANMMESELRVAGTA